MSLVELIDMLLKASLLLVKIAEYIEKKQKTNTAPVAKE